MTKNRKNSLWWCIWFIASIAFMSIFDKCISFPNMIGMSIAITSIFFCGIVAGYWLKEKKWKKMDFL